MARPVFYADRLELEQEIIRRQMFDEEDEFEDTVEPPLSETGGGMGSNPIFKRTAKRDSRQPLRTD